MDHSVDLGIDAFYAGDSLINKLEWRDLSIADKFSQPQTVIVTVLLKTSHGLHLV